MAYFEVDMLSLFQALGSFAFLLRSKVYGRLGKAKSVDVFRTSTTIRGLLGLITL